MPEFWLYPVEFLPYNVVHVAICSTFWSVTLAENFNTKVYPTKMAPYLTIPEELAADLTLVG